MRITENILKPLIERVQATDWKQTTESLLEFLKRYAIRAGRFAAKPLLQFYCVLTDENTTTRDKALIYGALLYVLVPGDLIPRKVFHLLGIADDFGAFLLAYSRIRSKITPAINFRVEEILDNWFGTRAEEMKEEN